jgi:hypothetical protein
VGASIRGHGILHPSFFQGPMDIAVWRRASGLGIRCGRLRRRLLRPLRRPDHPPDVCGPLRRLDFAAPEPGPLVGTAGREKKSQFIRADGPALIVPPVRFRESS